MTLNSDAKIVIFTSNHTRHRYVAARLIEVFGILVRKVFFEGRTYVPREIGKTPEEEAVLSWHFDLRERMEEKYFARIAQQGIGEIPFVTCNYNDLSSDTVLAELKDIDPDVIAVFGTSVIQDTVIDAFPGRIINMHLGLSPYYRGSGTNFWALYNEEPEYVGATIHFLDRGIDSGEIIHHARPMIKQGDNQHDIGCKTIIAGTEKLIQAVREKLDGTIRSYPQWSEGARPFCYRKHFTPQKAAELKEKFENGLVEKYCVRESRVRDSLRLIP